MTNAIHYIRNVVQRANVGNTDAGPPIPRRVTKWDEVYEPVSIPSLFIRVTVSETWWAGS